MQNYTRIMKGIINFRFHLDWFSSQRTALVRWSKYCNTFNQCMFLK